MGEILNIRDRHRRLAAKRGFEKWVRKFSEPFDQETSIADLSDSTLGILIQGNEESSLTLHDFIMGVMGMGPGLRFHFLENAEKMALMDVSFFLLDQLRFEAMRRLRWVEDHPNFHVPMIDLVDCFTDRFSKVRHEAPALSRDHRFYKDYEKAFAGDRSSFIRRLVPMALDEFQKHAAK